MKYVIVKYVCISFLITDSNNDVLRVFLLANLHEILYLTRWLS